HWRSRAGQEKGLRFGSRSRLYGWLMSARAGLDELEGHPPMDRASLFGEVNHAEPALADHLEMGVQQFPHLLPEVANLLSGFDCQVLQASPRAARTRSRTAVIGTGPGFEPSPTRRGPSRGSAAGSP